MPRHPRIIRALFHAELEVEVLADIRLALSQVMAVLANRYVRRR